MIGEPTATGGERLLYLDCFSGLAGDMILAALIDLGVPLDAVRDAVARLPLSGYGIRLERERRQTIDAARFFVDVDEAHQPHRHYSDIRELIAGAGLDGETTRLAQEIFAALARAEARVHGATVDDVHFHEVGAVDSIVDIVGIAAALAHLGAAVECAPPPLGRGFVETRHGTLPLPAPATLFLLEGVPVHGTEIEAELVTPTGAAVVKACARRFGPLPPMVIEAVGFGAGSRSHPGRPGLLRAVLGRAVAGAGSPGGTHAVLEANLDDITGQLAGAVLERLLEQGALDAWITPIQMKKGRPALTLSALCRRDDLERIAAVFLAESTTIGLRHHPVGRFEMEREIREADTPYGRIRIKLARGPGGARNAAPEFEDCRRAARETGAPLKQVLAAAAAAAREIAG
jgi:hypothetical protein